MKFISAILAAIAVGCLSTAALSQSSAVQWTTESGGNGNWYQGLIVSPEGASWTTARTFAIARGGDLAVVPSETFAQWLFTNTVDNTTLWAQSVGPWVGGYQLTGSIEPSGGWLWVNGSEILPAMWSSGQPDDATYCGGDNNRMGYWNAGEGVPKPYLQDSPDLAVIPCVGPVISAIVEWSTDCNSDGIVDYGQILSGQLADANGNNVPDCCESQSWATVLEYAPNPAVVTDANLRAAITAAGLPWRVVDNGTGIEMLLVPGGTFMMGCSP